LNAKVLTFIGNTKKSQLKFVFTSLFIEIPIKQAI